MNGLEKLIFGLALGLFAGWWACRLCAPAPQPPAYAERRDTVVRVDTLRIVEPRVVERVAVRILRDTLLLASTGEPAEVDVPIEQAHYADSLYEAWVSGYRPALDSIRIFAPVRTIEIERTVGAKPRRWSLGIQAGVGLTPRGVQPYVGAGVAYRIDF